MATNWDDIRAGETLSIIWAYVADFFSTPERVTAAVLTLSTIALWWSTRRLWKVTRIPLSISRASSVLTFREARDGPKSAPLSCASR
jgi:hypothetical protein